jgi:Fe-S-cluster-containing dehydrogenase component/anaerobic selenocysteine-containing dehydrogenase
MKTTLDSTPRDTGGIDRREFLRLSSAMAAAGALATAGCQMPPETSVPFHDMPEQLAGGIGRARFFHTVLDGSPVLVRTREGRPILVTPPGQNPSGRGLSVRHHAALMDLYDPDRARGPLSVRRSSGAPVAVNWTAVSQEVVSRLKSAGSAAALVTGPVSSPAMSSAIAALSARTGLRHVSWSPLPGDAAATAWQAAFGTPRPCRPRIENADLIVGLGAEFLDRPEDGLEAGFAARRAPDAADGRGMSRFIQFEGRLTLTGANADRRIRVRDSHLAMAAAALAHELIVTRGLGRLTSNDAVTAALAPFGLDAVAAKIGVDAGVLRGVADELSRAQGRSLVVAGGSASSSISGEALELAAILLNLTLGAYDASLFEVDARGPAVPAGAGELARLAGDMLEGRVQLLIVAGVNPLYDAPPAWRLPEAFANVPVIVSLNDRLDETSRLSDLLAPSSHPFECWGDAELPRQVFAVQQPVVSPLFDTRGGLDLVVEWAAAVGDPLAMAAVGAAAAAVQPPLPATAEPARSTSVGYHYVKAAWAARLGQPPASPEFENAWAEVLRAGAWQAQASAPPALTFSESAASLLARAATTNGAQAIELQLYLHLALADGRSGNNAWLHELPDPITRLTWGGAISIAPRRFDDMGLQGGDLVEIDTGFGKLVAPAYRHAGMHHDQVAVPLGLGREACGAIGRGVGRNAFALQALVDGRLVASGLPATIRRIDGHEPLAFGQGSDVIDRARRPLVPTTTLTAFETDPRAGTEQPAGGPSAWKKHHYTKARWAMAIDLSKCNGCGKCVIGCQAENNVPVVGRHGMLDGREMSWLRIDRYYDAPKKDGGWDADVWDGPLDVVEDPQTLFEPMLCQHCENAPCETVCPFVATMHSEDGVNQQIYNRCVGTRYCANNCPFKVRRFNYWEYSKPQESRFFQWLVPRIARNAELNTREPMQLKNNPEVTVRSRGVMEKCSFCVQRIRAARAEATRDGRDKDHLPDGAVVPACMEACPTGAITFGDSSAPDSRVTALAEGPRAMRLLDALGVQPAITYLTKVRNDKA